MPKQKASPPQPPEQEDQLTVVRKDFADVQKAAAALQIVDDASKAIGNESVSLLKKIIAAAEQSRKAKLAPYKEKTDNINAQYKAFSDPANALLSSLSKKLIAYDRKVREEAARIEAENQRRIEEAQRKQAALAKKAEKKGEEPPPLVPVHIQEVPVISKSSATTFGAVTIKECWTWEVVNEAEVPRQYLTLDQAKITRLVKAGERTIPGIRIFDKGSV